ncbi:DedA family protein [Alphaproteobacteria bacterium endosymbiont of Tiliacea citrago]|uniref:DedA family protein n=1 Tax=Alphaproteobacteria bacterium endosymbiont of Tiliacea citrago TaxID=3077944 RepID=UPI00313DD1A2
MIFNAYDFTLKWGYWGLTLASAIKSEAVVICISSLSKEMNFNLFYILILSLIGSFIGTVFLFLIGRGFKQRLLKFNFFQKKVEYLNSKIDNYGSYFIIFFRFIYGIKLISPIILGFSKISMKTFFLFNLLGSFLWSFLMVLIGWCLSLFCFAFSFKLLIFVYFLTIIIPFLIGFFIKLFFKGS